VRKKYHKVNIPNEINNDLVGFNFLAEIAGQTIAFINVKIEIDFSNCNFFAGHLCAVLGSIIYGLQERKNTVEITCLPNNLKGFLSRNKFLEYFANTTVPIINNTSIPFSVFEIDDEHKVKEYVELQLLNRSDMPIVSQGLKKEMVKSIFEIYVNAITHGNCGTVFSCGQCYPRKDPPEIYFTFVDLGKTIKNNVAEYLKSGITGVDSIIWATSDNNSTKVENHSGGLGLKLIKEFIELNNGIIQIVSANGFWELNRGRVFTKTIHYDFPGTIVNLVFNLRDTHNYFLKSEIDIKNIF
jgi:hypothetical protein